MCIRDRYDDLPILPEPFRYVLAKGKEDAFQNLKLLMEREDVTELVNACDAGREGELIFRLVYEAAGCSKPFSRLWISSMEDAAIREGFADLRQFEETLLGGTDLVELIDVDKREAIEVKLGILLS